MEGRVTNLFIKSAHGRPMQPMETVKTVSGEGILGDSSFGSSKRQVLLVDMAVLETYDLRPGDLRENITISGLTLSNLSRGAIVHIGGTSLEITGDCKPCDMVNDLKQGLRDEIDGHRGMLARIHNGGFMSVGDIVSLTES
jgi:hypothetical protein